MNPEFYTFLRDSDTPQDCLWISFQDLLLKNSETLLFTEFCALLFASYRYDYDDIIGEQQE